jgi:hypothetical protein
MTILKNAKISGIISWIKETEEMIQMWEADRPSPVANLMIHQFEDLKRDFVKQLLTELLSANHNISDIEPFIHSATSYLKKFDTKKESADNLSADLKEVESLMYG